ncbi:MAG TPA: quinone oxidoreductase [Deltaproteobacteria bacterium]|nr:quinone oxidoreductase [Deltaproteobacteria bacterium]
MKAIQIQEVGGPEKMSLVEIEKPSPGPGQVRVRIEAAGINYIDTYHRSGLYPVPLPFVPGVEAAGRVDAVGEGVDDFAPGDRVAWTGVPGAYAEFALAPADGLVRLPAGLSSELAAATLLQGMTAHYLVHGVRETRPGDRALVHAAAGGTGGLLVQLLKQAGARVIATCGNEEKARLARESGADEVILYRDEDFQARTREWSDGRGVDVVYDSVGQATFEGSLGSLRPRGLLCLFGQASGPVPPFDLGRLNTAGSLFITRPSLAHYVADRESLDLRANAIYEALEKGTLVQRIGGRYDLADATRAHLDLEGRGTIGKLLILPD